MAAVYLTHELALDRKVAMKVMSPALLTNQGMIERFEREARTVAKLRPEWNTWLATVKARDKAMDRDALTTTHAIVQRIETVEQATQAFDTITYEKGEAVIRMLEGYVGAEAWREGVRRYIRKHAYGNTVSEDLWREIEAAAAQPIRGIAHDFTEQPGIPLIRIDDVACVDGQSEVLVSQAEFSKDRPGKTPLRWQVPMIASTVGGAVTRTIVTGGKARLKLAGCGPLILNVGQSGYYRTLYGPAQFRVLASKFESVAPIDQLGLLSDARALGRAGLQPASDVLELAKAAPLDTDPQVWGMIADIYNEIDDDARADPARRATFRAFAADHAFLPPNTRGPLRVTPARIARACGDSGINLASPVLVLSAGRWITLLTPPP
jgi:aminopeptidase N